MEFIGKIIIYIIMACAFIGAMASVFKKHSQLGKEFIKGAETVGTIFLPVGGIMALSPVLTEVIMQIIAPFYNFLGLDPSLAATTIIASDMGGYQLAHSLSASNEAWMMALIIGYMSGATIVFTIPIALKILKKEDHEFLAYGVMAGFISIPIGVLIASLTMMLTQPIIRSEVLTSGIGSYQLDYSLIMIFKNLAPLILVCLMIVIGLYFKPKKMISGFQIFGVWLNNILKIVFVLCVIEHFTQLFSSLLELCEWQWPLDPMVADNVSINRALESTGYISMMLCGAFPMVYLIQKYGKLPLLKLSNKTGISIKLMTGVVACSANVLALLAMVKDMDYEDKIKTIAFSVGCAFLLGDHLAFTANFQPSLVLPIMLGKLGAGISAILIAKKWVIPIIWK